VFLPWGATFNYGHFVIDALPSLLALERAGLLDRAGRGAQADRLAARPDRHGLSGISNCARSTRRSCV
jgi:hypothetical protein